MKTPSDRRRGARRLPAWRRTVVAEIMLLRMRPFRRFLCTASSQIFKPSPMLARAQNLCDVLIRQKERGKTQFDVNQKHFANALDMLQAYSDPRAQLLASRAEEFLEPNKLLRKIMKRGPKDLEQVQHGLLERLSKGSKELRHNGEQLFSHLLDTRQASTAGLVLILANVCKSSNSAREWLNRAHDAGLPMDAVPFNRLLCELRLEGRDDELEGVLSEMDARGIVRDVKTEKYLSLPAEELSRMRRARLQELAEDGDFARMKELFESLLARRQADWIHLNVAMLHLCKDYASRRELLRHAETAGVSPSTSTYNLLLSTLQMEGRKDELEGVLSEMDARGIVRDVKTEKYLSLPAEELSRMRRARLQELAEDGDFARMKELFESLLARRQADWIHLNVAMLHLCKDYASRRELLRHAETAGVSPSTSTYNLLLSTLQMEGRKDELEGVLSEMDARGIVRDVKTETYLTLPAEELSRMRAAFLKKLVNAGEQETAQGVLDRLISRNEAHQAHHAIVARAGRHE